MARQFQGYARGRGFSRRSAGAGAISRIQEQGNKTVQGLKEQLQSKRQRDQQYAADLDSNFRREQEIKQEIKTFEDKAFDLKMRNIKQNQEQSLLNIETEGKNQAAKYQQLSKFSSTLGDAIVDTKNSIEQAQKESEFVAYELPFLEQPTQQDRLAEDALRQADVNSSNSLKQLVTEEGLPMPQAQEAMAASPYKHLKNIDARAQAATNEYLASATYDNYGPELAHAILKKYNLLGVNKRRLFGFATTYAKTRSGYEASNNAVRAINVASEKLNTVTANYLDNRSKENRLALIQTLAEHTTDGKSFIDRSEQLNLLYKIHENEAVTDEDRQAFFSQPLLDSNGKETGRTYGEQFKDTRNVELLNNVEKQRIERVEQRSNVVKAEQLDNYLKTRDEIIKLGEQGNIDYETYKPMLDDLDVSSDQRNKLNEELYAISNDKVSNDALIAQADYMISTGQDISDVARQMTGKARSKYLDLANKQKVDKTEAGIDDKAIRRTVKSALIKALGQQNVGDDKDPTLELALEDALIDIGKDTVVNAANASLADSSKAALQLKLQEIASNSGKYEVKGIGKGNSKSTGNFFSYFTPEGKYFTEVVKANASEAIRAVRNRPESRKDVFLVTTNDLATVYNAVLNKENYQLPYALKELQKAYPDTLQLQLNKYADEFGKPRITVPLTYQQVLSARQDDKRAQRFMMQVETIQEERIIPLIADDSTKMSAAFFAPAVAEAYGRLATTAFDTGSVVGDISIDGARRAIIGKESTNNFRAVNKDSGALGFAQVMPSNVGPWSQEILGRTVSPQEFLNNPSVQMAIINGKLEKYFQQESAKGFTGELLLRRVASIWYSGQADLYDNEPDEYYNGKKYPSIRNYTKDIAKRYRSGV